MLTAAAPLPLLDRIAAQWRAKAFYLGLIVPLCGLCYFLPQVVSLRPPAQLPLLAIDRAVPFSPWWIFPYMSMYLLLPIPPLLAVTGAQIRRYAQGMLLMYFTAAIIFVIWPVIYPRPPIDASGPAFYRLITSIDRPVNTIPSLHAGLTVYALLFAAAILKDLPGSTRQALLTIGGIWAAIILYATLATHQHYFLDLPPGALLAYLAHRAAGKLASPPRW